MLYDEENQGTPWRNELAEQMNTVLARIQYLQETANDESDQEFCKAALAIVERVAEFEEIVKASNVNLKE
jgi:hypothetical protein